MKSKSIKVLSITMSLLGIGTSLISGWLEDEKLNNLVTEKVAEELAKQSKNRRRES